VLSKQPACSHFFQRVSNRNRDPKSFVRQLACCMQIKNEPLTAHPPNRSYTIEDDCISSQYCGHLTRKKIFHSQSDEILSRLCGRSRSSRCDNSAFCDDTGLGTPSSRPDDVGADERSICATSALVVEVLATHTSPGFMFPNTNGPNRVRI
jgi:hypothetical protein